MHESIGRYGGLLLGLVASEIITEMEDRSTEELKISSYR